MLKSATGRPSELLIFDTGPIRELVLFHAVYDYGFRSLKEDLRFIRDRNSYEICRSFIATFRKRTTSASVIAELYHWIRRDTQGSRRSRIWGRVYEEFLTMGMNEEAVRLLEMEQDFVVRFGPIDGSLIELARRHEREKPVILTTDSPLHGQCWKAGLRVSMVEEIVLAPR